MPSTARSFGNRHNLPEPVCAVLTADSYDKGRANISVTGLIQSPRVRILGKEGRRYDIADMVWTSFGTAWHSHAQAALNGYNPDWVVEERYFVDINGWVVSGQADLQTIKDDGTIHLWDWKVTTTTKIAKGLAAEWEQQLNCYAYLIRRSTGKIVTSATVLAILRDYKRNLFKRQEHGECAVSVMDIGLWPKDQQESYIKQRVSLHQDVEMSHAMGDKLIHCTDLEQWRKPNSYAVMVEGKKRAKMICDTQAEAEFQAGMIEGGYVETRFGIPLKCQANYCGVSKRCDQLQEEKLYQILGKRESSDQYGD
jgi:hypothetical protein